MCSNFLSTPDAASGVCVEQNSLEIGKNATKFHTCKGNNIILLKDGYYVCSIFLILEEHVKMQENKVWNVLMK